MNIDAPRLEQAEELRALWKEAFGDPDAYLDAFYGAVSWQSHCRCITLEDQLAAALYWFDCCHEGEKIAYIYAVATAKAFRGRGLCHALMEDTFAHLASLGYQGAVLVPQGDSLFRFYETMGYRICSYVRTFRCAMGEESVPVHKATREEYARLRRALLPEGGVIQQGENLTFLEIQLSLYAGEGFVLTGREEDGIFYAMELLGDSEKAPGILKTLGCREGVFRTSGDEKPFAMYRPFAGSTLAAPKYFGLPFD